MKLLLFCDVVMMTATRKWARVETQAHWGTMQLLGGEGGGFGHCARSIDVGDIRQYCSSPCRN